MSGFATTTTKNIPHKARSAHPVALRNLLLPAVRKILQSISIFTLLFLLWHIIVYTAHPAQYLLPKPITVWHDMWAATYNWPGTIWITSQEILEGFFIAAGAGVALAIIIAWTPILSRTLLPFLIAFNTLPKIAIAPLFIIYLGYGVFPNAVIAAMVAFFPIIIPSATGLVQIQADWLDLARSLGAPKWKVFLRLRLPNSLPFVFGGLKVGSSLAVTGAVIGEFIASQGGLGNTILSTQTTLDTALAFAALVWLSILGLLIYACVGLVERIVVPWAVPVRETNETH